MIFFFFNDTATTEIYTLSLHDALPISGTSSPRALQWLQTEFSMIHLASTRDRKSTRLNSSHQIISYAVFCLKKKKKRLHSRFLSFVSISCNSPCIGLYTTQRYASYLCQ